MSYKAQQNSKKILISMLLVLVVSACGGGGSSSNPEDQTEPNYTLQWSDEFNGNALDRTKWNYETGYGSNNAGWGNNESQLYTESSDNLTVENGNLVITARCDSGNCGVRNGSITSAKINTKGLYGVKYGKIEARIKVPNGRSTWPAFWMLGESFPDVAWPQSGEIDVMEAFQTNNSTINTANTAIHWQNAAGGHQIDAQHTTLSAKLSDDFHVFSIEWGSKYIVGTIDGQQYYVRAINFDDMSEFHERFYLILNVAIGGALGGVPDAIKTTPQQMLVDWVRVYKHKNDGEISAVISESTFDSGLISNGDFELGASHWAGNASNVTGELLGVDASKANFADVNAAGNPWDVNLSQAVSLDQGTQYKLSFSAKSNVSRTIVAGSGLNADPWTSHTETKSLTTEWQTFEVAIPASNTGSNSRILFDLGAAAGQVIIDNVSVFKVQ